MVVTKSSRRFVEKAILSSVIAASVSLTSPFGGKADAFHVHIPAPKEVVHDAGTIIHDTTKAATAPIANSAKVIKGQESVGDAVKNTAKAQGAPLVDAGETISAVNAKASNTEEQAINDLLTILSANTQAPCFRSV